MSWCPADGCGTRLLADRIPGARLEILPGADHVPPMRTATAFAGLLAGCMDSLQR
jgi:pimeloyl-ACP methyl ester carboxylesterase